MFLMVLGFWGRGRCWQNLMAFVAGEREAANFSAVFFKKTTKKHVSPALLNTSLEV